MRRTSGKPSDAGLEAAGAPHSSQSGAPVRHDRAIRSLSDHTGLPQEAIRALLVREYARLERGAKVRSYLLVLAAANVRTAVHRRSIALTLRDGDAYSAGGALEPARVAGATATLGLANGTRRPAPTIPTEAQAQIESWEGEGGA